MATQVTAKAADLDVTWRVFRAVVEVLQTDPTGHRPDCGYTEAAPNCGCAAWGGRLHRAISDAVAGGAGMNPDESAALVDEASNVVVRVLADHDLLTWDDVSGDVVRALLAAGLLREPALEGPKS